MWGSCLIIIFKWSIVHYWNYPIWFVTKIHLYLQCLKKTKVAGPNYSMWPLPLSGQPVHSGVQFHRLQIRNMLNWQRFSCDSCCDLRDKSALQCTDFPIWLGGLNLSVGHALTLLICDMLFGKLIWLCPCFSSKHKCSPLSSLSLPLIFVLFLLALKFV